MKVNQTDGRCLQKLSKPMISNYDEHIITRHHICMQRDLYVVVEYAKRRKKKGKVRQAVACHYQRANQPSSLSES